MHVSPMSKPCVSMRESCYLSLSCESFMLFFYHKHDYVIVAMSVNILCQKSRKRRGILK